MSPSELHLNRAAYVRSLLAWHGKRQSDLAAIIGCSQQNASQKLAGKRRFTTDDLLAIASALDVDPRYLLTVPQYERGLLTCTKCQLGQVSGIAAADYGQSAPTVRREIPAGRFPTCLPGVSPLRIVDGSRQSFSPTQGGQLGNVA